MITILLIRGLSRQQGHWGEFPKCLEREFEKQGLEFKIAFEDLPGFGKRHQQTSPSNIAKIAELLVPTLEKLSIESHQKIHLVGISMGGMVAMELAGRFPEYCESLVMINSSVKPVARFYQRLRPKAYPAFLKAWFHPFMRESERQILKISSENRIHDEILLDNWLELRKNNPPSRIAAIKQLIAASRFEAPSRPPINKVLLVASKNDHVASYLCTVNLANYWQVESVIHETAGHDLALDEPEWLARVCLDWFI